MSTLAQPNTSASKRLPLPGGLLIATILLILQVVARAGFLISPVVRDFEFLGRVGAAFLLLALFIPVLLLILTIVMIALIFARTPAARPYGITVCILNLVFQIYSLGRLFIFYSSHPEAVSALPITISIAYLAIFTAALVFLIRWPMQDLQEHQYVPAAGSLGQSYRGMAKASLICGICGPLAMIILGPIALGLGIAARAKMRASNNFDGAGMALAGIIIGAVETVVSVSLVLLAIAMRS